jgi:hypothetical protein
MEQADRERRGKTNVDEFGTGTKQMVLEVWQYACAVKGC